MATRLATRALCSARTTRRLSGLASGSKAAPNFNVAGARDALQNTTTPAAAPMPTRTTIWPVVDDKGDYRVQRADNVVKVTLTRPRNGNALTTTMVEGITQLFQDLAHDQDVFHVILDAEGKYFCTGMDISSSGSSASNDASEKAAYYSKIEALYQAIDSAPQTTIAVIDGPCFGGGVGLAFVCDIRLASSAARFTLTEVKLGLSPAIISKYMIREWSVPFVREAILSARDVSPEELHRLGIIHQLATDSQHLEGALLPAYLHNLKQCAPRAAAACKELVRLGWRDAGGEEQQKFVKKVFAGMMEPGSEGEHGLAQFRMKVKGVDWGEFWATKKKKKIG